MEVFACVFSSRTPSTPSPPQRRTIQHPWWERCGSQRASIDVTLWALTNMDSLAAGRAQQRGRHAGSPLWWTQQAHFLSLTSSCAFFLCFPFYHVTTQYTQASRRFRVVGLFGWNTCLWRELELFGKELVFHGFVSRRQNNQVIVEFSAGNQLCTVSFPSFGDLWKPMATEGGYFRFFIRADSLAFLSTLQNGSKYILD